MKKIIALLLAVIMLLSMAACGGNASADFTVGICQLMEHESLDKATEGFKAALTAALEAEGKTVSFDEQVAGGSDLCTTVVSTFTAKNVDLSWQMQLLRCWLLPMQPPPFLCWELL